MIHPDEQELVLLALGEDVLSADSLAHLHGCTRCTSELEQLTRVVELGREAGQDRRPSEPAAPALWDGIAARLDLPAAPSIDRKAVPSPPAEVPVRRSGGRRRTVLLAAAVLAAIAGVGVGILIGRATDRPVAIVSSSSAQLAPVAPTGPQDAVGKAVVTQDGGSTTLTVSTEHLPLQNGFYQVWLYDQVEEKMVPVGTLDGSGGGTFTVTPSIDLRSFNIIDISVQQLDGNPAHGTSMLQGSLSLG